MLINCKECGLIMSSDAIFCPHCGYIYKPDKMPKPKKRSRLPNGFGQITKLHKKNLRKPYRAMVSVGKTDDGKPIQRLLEPVAYFETYNEAYSALLEFNKNPYIVNRDATFKEVYDDWYEEHSKRVSDSRMRSIRYTMNKLTKYYDVKLSDIKPKVLNSIIDEFKTDTGENRKKIKTLFNQVMDYAVMNEIIDRNYARISNIKIDDPNQVKKGHITFTDDEISLLWKNIDRPYVSWILMQCYTGMRPGELCEIRLENINLDDNYMIGGIKTEAGKDRIIPIHKAIKSLIEKQISYSRLIGSEYLLSEYGLNKIEYDVYKRRFYDVRTTLRLNVEHTPHDCRKFFISQAKKYKLDEYALKRIVGHKISDLTERVYTVRESDWLYDEINKISV